MNCILLIGEWHETKPKYKIAGKMQRHTIVAG